MIASLPAVFQDSERDPWEDCSTSEHTCHSLVLQFQEIDLIWQGSLIISAVTHSKNPLLPVADGGTYPSLILQLHPLQGGAVEVTASLFLRTGNQETGEQEDEEKWLLDKQPLASPPTQRDTNHNSRCHQVIHSVWDIPSCNLPVIVGDITNGSVTPLKHTCTSQQEQCNQTV